MSSDTTNKYQVEVDQDKCMGCGTCAAIAPQVFKLDESGKATVMAQNGNDDETKLMAAQSCPAMAIKVTETETGQQIWPEPA